MAHPQQLQFVKSIAASLGENFRIEKVVEIGAYDVNGSIRRFFPNTKYLGVDLIEGPGVDLVCEGDKVSVEDSTYDLSISCECFEHNPRWVETFLNMCRMTKDGGAVLFTCATTGRAEHGTNRTTPRASPGTQALRWDYYKNLDEGDFEGAVNLKSLFVEYFFMVNHDSFDLYFFGVKGGEKGSSPVNVKNLEKLCLQDQEDLKRTIERRKRFEKFIPRPLRKTTRRFMNRWLIKESRARLIDDF